MASNVDYKKVRIMTDMLAATFELVAANERISKEELLELQSTLVKKNGKYGNNYEDKLSKLAFDYHFVLEMLEVLYREEWLSFPRRERLYRFATKNQDVQDIWSQFPNMMSPKVFLDDEELKISKINRRHRHK